MSRTLGTAPRNDVWIADISSGELQSLALQAIQIDVDATTSIHVGNDGRLYVFTDRDAPRGRLCVTDPTTPSYETWRELVPEDPEAVLDDFAILDGMVQPVLMVARTRHATSELTVHDLGTGDLLRTVDAARRRVDWAASARGPRAAPRRGWAGPGSPRRRACCATTPSSRLADDVGRSARQGRRCPPCHSQVVTYPSKDGTLVRMFVVSPTGAPDHPRPTTLYGYGGFNIPMTPGFSAGILSWVEAGGVYAIACLRGGSEEGEDWHRAGRRDAQAERVRRLRRRGRVADRPGLDNA